MDYKNGGKVPEIMNRFKWVNSDCFHLINEEGVEKLVDVT
jgi:hypothetical protein